MNLSILPIELRILLDLGKVVLIGSRGLGVHTSSSDYDLALLWDDLPQSFRDVPVMDIRNYFNFLPMHNSGLLKLDGVDVLLFDSPDDMRVIRQAKADLLTMPKYLLEPKPVRILLFESALSHYGWSTTSFTINEEPVINLNLDDIPFDSECRYTENS